MPRLSDDTINRIKTEVDLLGLVAGQGFKPKAHGKDKVIPCPFHQDDTASCVISPASNLFHCFGCGAAGSVIDWVMKTQGVSFRFACDLLQNDLGNITDVNVVKRARNKTVSNPLAACADQQQILQQVLDHYNHTLTQTPAVLDYLQRRGLNHPELIDTFKLGYANRTLGYRLPNSDSIEGAEIYRQLKVTGLLRKTGHEHFSGCLVVPVIDENGLVHEVYGRKTSSKLSKKDIRHLYLPGLHQGVWNVVCLQGTDEVILCEALIDAMTFWVNGFRNVTSSFGTGGFTDDHLAAFKTHNIKRVLIAYDGDHAGDSAAETVAETLQAAGIECYRVQLPLGMDVNELAKKATQPQKELSQIIRHADPMLSANARAGAVAEVVTEQTSVLRQPLANHTVAPAEPPNVSPLPASPVVDIPATVSADEVVIKLEKRVYRVRGLDKNTSPALLKINLMVKQTEGDNSLLHVDTIDLYNSRARQGFIKQTAFELGANPDDIKADMGLLLVKLEALQAERMDALLAPENLPPVMTPKQEQTALALLKDPALLSRILTDFNACGVVGEAVNTLVGYVAAVSRKLAKPLAVMIQSSSAAGKSSLMDAVLNLVPEEERVQYSAMTGQSLFYMGETCLKNKILAIAEEEGAENASYALKLLQSEGEVSIASTGKNAVTGALETQEHRVEGPVMLFLTTTAIDIDEELMNRCLVLTVNESREQTQAIHTIQRQKRTLAGLLASAEKDSLTQLHQNAQRLLKTLAVVNPFADKLSFLDNQTRTRRDHEKYLTLIDSIALLHQHQRETKSITHHGQVIEYIEVTLDDIAVANAMANEVLGRTLDELPPQTRTLLSLIYTMAQANCRQLKITQQAYRFSRRDIREYTDWGNTQLKVHCQRLEEMEYLIVQRGGPGKPSVYELAWQGEGEQGSPFVLGLADLKKLDYDDQRSGVNEVLSALGRGVVGVKSAAGRAPQNGVKASKTNGLASPDTLSVQNTLIEVGKNSVEQSCVVTQSVETLQ